jgi:hypothetical protein
MGVAGNARPWMQFSKPQKYLVFAVVTTIVITGVFYSYLDYSLKHMQLDLSGLDVLVGRLTATVRIATLTALRCGSPAEYPPTGDRRREATMLYVATIVDLYKTTFGKLPDSVDDLDKLPSFDNADKLNGRQVKKSCAIDVDPSGSYVLACGASIPPAREIDPLLRKAGRVERFYMLDGAEALYVPAVACP